MRQIRNITIIYTLLVIISFSVVFYISRHLGFEKRDIANYNKMVYDINDEYIAGATIEELEQKYDCRIILTTKLVEKNITEYYASSALVLDFAPEGEIIGKVIWNDNLNAFENSRNSMINGILVAMAAFALTGYILILMIWFNMIRPVQDLQNFSEEIAKGNLDMTLPVRRGNLFGNFTESFDIMREELVKSKNREIEADKARKELVAELSHDIKTPVSTIKATCEVLDTSIRHKGTDLTEKDMENYLEKVGYISTKAETINKLIGNMFHATLEEIDELQVNVEEMNSLLIQDYFKELKDYGNIILENDIPECLVYADNLRMEQAIDNVVANSYKYAGTEIRVSFEMTEIMMESEKTAQFLRITIRDKGPGVPENDLPLIAEKYYRGKNTDNKTGYGLGLYLVKWYMEKQGGGMEYYNDDGFVVELLVKKV